MSDSIVRIGNYVIRLDKKIGEGKFGKVYRGYDRTNTEIRVACKIIKTRNLSEGQINNIIQEVKTMKRLRKSRNPHLVRLIKVAQSEENYYILMELCERGDLRKFLKVCRQKKTMTIEVIQSIAKQIAIGLFDMYRNRIMHRDLKPDNIFLSKNKLKIGDFGLCKILPENDSLTTTFLGTPLYIAPEISLRKYRYTNLVDLWSTGCILYECFTSKSPFNASNIIEVMMSSMNPENIHYPKEMDPLLKDLISRLLVFEQKYKKIPWKNRMTFPEFFSHPFLDLRMLAMKARLFPISETQSMFSISVISVLSKSTTTATRNKKKKRFIFPSLLIQMGRKSRKKELVGIQKKSVYEKQEWNICIQGKSKSHNFIFGDNNNNNELIINNKKVKSLIGVFLVISEFGFYEEIVMNKPWNAVSMYIRALHIIDPLIKVMNKEEKENKVTEWLNCRYYEVNKKISVLKGELIVKEEEEEEEEEEDGEEEEDLISLEEAWSVEVVGQLMFSNSRRLILECRKMINEEKESGDDDGDEIILFKLNKAVHVLRYLKAVIGENEEICTCVNIVEKILGAADKHRDY